ncbi:MAG: MerR family transcriptional regulator [Oscillibacter sp.]|nr:MerR family transcriptional regulator [Oscillibacter sp.]
MQDYFTIGEISALLGLTSHTLRYYDKIGLLHPAVVNQQTGYRSYAYQQLFTLERIRHLQYLGFNLEDIREILSDASMDTFLRLLNRKKRELDAEIEHLTALRNTVEQYQSYYRYYDDRILPQVPFKAHFGQRYLFAEEYRPGEPLCGTAGYRLMVRKSEPDCAALHFLREIGFLLDYGALRSGRIRPTHYYMFLENLPKESMREIQTIPAGDFLCFRCHMLEPGADISPLLRLMADDGKSRTVLACEYEQNMDDSIQAFERSYFEIQIQL